MTNETISNQYEYDINGNITSIKDGNNITITLTYKAKDLETYSDSSKQIYERYYYNDKHLRVKKEILDSNGNVTSTITYTYDNNDNLIYQKQGNISLTFLYDNSNMLYGFIYNGYTYYYIRSILNDILGIVDIQGNKIVEYRYLDAWGNHSVFSRKVIHRSSISDSIIDGTLDNVPNTDPSFIGNINPFRYKGYYYDKETNLFYVTSRYYSPELCRWISPDSIEYLDPQSINGLNLYAYCGNDPVNNVDPTGHAFIFALLISIGIGIAVGLAGQLTSDLVTSAINGEWTFSSWEMYLGAGLGGALAGALFAVGAGGFVTGALSGGLTAFVGNGLEMAHGKQDIDIAGLLVNTFAEALIGGITGSLINVKGINAGRSSLQKSFKIGLNAVKNGNKMSINTLAKGIALNAYTSYGTIMYSVIKNYSEAQGWI